MLLLAGLTCSIPHLGHSEPRRSPEADKAYQAFIAQLITPANVADCVAKMDGLIDDQERLSADNTRPTPNQSIETAAGIHLEYAVIRSPEASLFYFVVSRNGDDLRYDDATRLSALFCDRAGLPHPVTLKEGEKPVFYAQWLVKPSEWKEMSKMIKKVRAENRAEKDPQRAFAAAIRRELSARQAPEPPRK